MANVKMKAPDSISGKVMHGKTAFDVAGDKTVSVPEALVPGLESQGFKVVNEQYEKDQAAKQAAKH